MVPGAQRRRLRALAGLAPAADTRIAVTQHLTRLLDRRSRRLAWLAGLTASVVFGQLAGPVAALVAGIYVGTAITVAASTRRDRTRMRAAINALDVVAAIAAELRAGVDPEAAVSTHIGAVRATGVHGQVLADRIGAACRVAETIGARLADLLERLESDARAMVAAQARASAQAAGAQATAWLLAALPIAGLALGFGIGVNPVHVLFHTKAGAACAVAALGFQVAGLAWSRRLARSILDAAR